MDRILFSDRVQMGAFNAPSRWPSTTSRNKKKRRRRRPRLKHGCVIKVANVALPTGVKLQSSVCTPKIRASVCS